ncbi:MAG: hypothetical protein FRX48_05121 [Lasallia pustulata]|uniref:Clr5 domain-containing protein n=1 Tax=Lasallia pustulata TaxID=136370 RepID=A0A5M8PMN3_9LECA|nr:MAG: hypothetical protein FRX48_05121 [Lasallia pustulata]
MNQRVPQGPPNPLPNVPINEKWELLRPTIERLYIDEKLKLPKVIDAVKAQYGFDAFEHEYKRQIRKWKLRKNIPTPKKAALCDTLQTRAQAGKSTAVKYKGRDVDTKKLRRHLKTEARQDIALQSAAGRPVRDAGPLSLPFPQFGNRVFMNWNMPYGALRLSTAKAIDHRSPFGGAASTPSDVMVATPSSIGGVPSPTNAPSPMSVALTAKAANDRARLFVEGRHDDLLRSMEKQDRVTISNWLYQFWIFSFKTAKHWGRGPQDWTANILRFDRYQERFTLSAPNTPRTMMNSPGQRTNLRHDAMNNGSPQDAVQPPSDLCRWSIHIDYVEHKGVESPPPSPPANLDLDNEESWTKWPISPDPGLFLEKIQNGLESNDFSSIGTKDLPMAVTQIAKAAKRSQNELLKEALGFCIMARNTYLLGDLLDQIYVAEIDISGLYPFHLAASYLGGSKNCCNVLDIIHYDLSDESSLRIFYVNDLGHTILDNLMLSILKAHTSCVPSIVDHVFLKEKRFAGEEVDICGRWDADSDCVRSLLANGDPAIPFEWKHQFCHTSVQTICHCIGTISFWAPINTPSGLFLKRCLQCGLKLQLLPLHTLILAAFHLAQHGCKGETLFGILACLLCLLASGANPMLKAHVSGRALLTDEQADECDHEELDPLQLTDKVPASFTSTWSTEVIVGWNILRHVLRHSQAEWSPRRSQRRPGPGYDEHDDEFGEFIVYGDDEMSIDEELTTDEGFPPPCTECDGHKQNFFGKSKVLATLWAAVQTEFLTYRRLKAGDSWISSNFDMHDLLTSLDAGRDIRIGLVQEKMMAKFCACGRFFEADDINVREVEACSHYFSNLEDGNRSTYIY